eukprot:1159404-Pelagomonas_calceolata.AAC.4
MPQFSVRCLSGGQCGVVFANRFLEELNMLPLFHSWQCHHEAPSFFIGLAIVPGWALQLALEGENDFKDSGRGFDLHVTGMLTMCKFKVKQHGRAATIPECCKLRPASKTEPCLKGSSKSKSSTVGDKTLQAQTCRQRASELKSCLTSALNMCVPLSNIEDKEET